MAIAPANEQVQPALPLYVMTYAATLCAHLVAEDAVISGRCAGEYQAVCGTLMQAASLTAEERSHCRRCGARRLRGQR